MSIHSPKYKPTVLPVATPIHNTQGIAFGFVTTVGKLALFEQLEVQIRRLHGYHLGFWGFATRFMRVL